MNGVAVYIEDDCSDGRDRTGGGVFRMCERGGRKSGLPQWGAREQSISRESPRSCMPLEYIKSKSPVYVDSIKFNQSYFLPGPSNEQLLR